MAKVRWEYRGDVNIEHGGLFFLDEGDDDFIRVVNVTPASDAGGPDNLFLVEVGSIYMPLEIERMKSAVETSGYTMDAEKNVTDHRGETYAYQSPEWRLIMMDAWQGYHGVEVDMPWIVRVGRPDKYARPGSFLTDREPDFILRSNTSLYRFVKGEFC